MNLSDRRSAHYLYETQYKLAMAAPQKLTGGSTFYYELPPDCQTLLDIIVKKEMTFTRGNILKGCYRWGAKPDSVSDLEYDLRKIIYFAQYELDRLNSEDPSNPRKRDANQ